MKIGTLGFLTCEQRVLLAPKKKGFGEGRWNGYGGSLETGEDVAFGLCREIREEAGVSVEPNMLRILGIVDYHFGGEPKMQVHVFQVLGWLGDPRESDEMGAPQWFPINALPFDRMWPADRFLLPVLFEGKPLKARVAYSKDGNKVEIVECSVQ